MWFLPLAVGGLILAVLGGLLLHLCPNRLLLIMSQIGLIISVLLFAIIPNRSDTGKPSQSFIYWAYIFPSLILGVIGLNFTYNPTNVFITSAMPRRLQSSVSGLINSLFYLGIAFWLGIAQMASVTAKQYQPDMSISDQYRVGFWVAVALSSIGLILMSTINLGKATAALTADEQAAQAAKRLSEAGITT